MYCILFCVQEGEAAQKLYDEMTESYPDHLNAHVAYMNSLDPSSDLRKLPVPYPKADWTKAPCEKIVSVANKVISSINQDVLLAYFGMKNDLRADAAKIKLSVIAMAPFKNVKVLSFIYFFTGNKKSNGICCWTRSTRKA